MIPDSHQNIDSHFPYRTLLYGGQLGSTLAPYFTVILMTTALSGVTLYNSQYVLFPSVLSVSFLCVCACMCVCSMTQSLSGSGQSSCFLRGLSGLLPSAVCTPERRTIWRSERERKSEREEEQWPLLESKDLPWMQEESLFQLMRCWNKNWEVEEEKSRKTDFSLLFYPVKQTSTFTTSFSNQESSKFRKNKIELWHLSGPFQVVVCIKNSVHLFKNHQY